MLARANDWPPPRRCAVRSISACVLGRQREDTYARRWFMVMDGGVVSNNQPSPRDRPVPVQLVTKLIQRGNRWCHRSFQASGAVRYESVPAHGGPVLLRLGRDAARLHLWPAFIDHLRPRSPVKRAVAGVATVFQRCRETMVP
jgi:hypothetical protein